MNSPILISGKTRLLNIMIHVIVLLMVFVLPEVVMGAIGRRPAPFFIYLHTLTYILTFYISYFLLIDRYLFKKRIVTYILLSLLLAVVMVCFMTVAQYVFHHFFEVEPFGSGRRKMLWQTPWSKKSLFMLGMFSRDFAMILLSIGLSIALKLSLRWTKIEKLNDKVAAEKREMELKHLKNQLNPHFLFNTLNNIYALIAIDADKAQNAVHELSKLLRYTLYENNEDKVTLDKELLFMRSYIELMKLRLSRNNILQVDIYDGPTNDLKIAPLMFISMVENAFKHGVSASKPSKIEILIELKGTIVHCCVENDIFDKSETDRSGSGIGLANLKRQLSLLYDGHYMFSAGVVDGRYVADLTIDLKEQNTTL